MKRLMAAVLFCFLINMPYGLCAEDVPLTLADTQKKIQSEFERLDAGLKKAATQLGESGLSGTGARKALRELCGGFSYAVDCTAVDIKGTMVTIEPAAYSRLEGADISGQEQVRKMMQTQKPVLSTVFKSVEGFDAADIEYPVTDREGKFIGSVSLLFKPEKFLGDIIRTFVKGVPVDIWVMETGGRILYDIDTKQIGLNLFSSPLYWPYKSLLEFGRKIARDQSGADSYTFVAGHGKKDAAKNAHWQTVSLYGTKWRVVGIHVPPGNAPRRTLAGTIVKPCAPLESLAGSKAFTTAAARSDNRSIMKLFRKFYGENPGIYSIQ